MIGTQFFGNTLQAPRWMADFGSRDHLEPWPAKLDASQFTDSAGVPVTVTASATQNATSVTVAALAPSLYPATTLITGSNVLIPAGTTLSFGGAKYARLTADAVVGATTLTVAALPTALAGTETATYSRYGSLTIPSGTFVGRTFVERDAGTPFGPADPNDDELFLLAFDVVNARVDNDAVMYRRGSHVKENYLPGYAALLAGGSTAQTVTITGTPTGGTFTLTYKGATTAGIAYNAAASAVQTALQALATIGTGNATVTGGPGPGTPYVVTFVGALGRTPADLLTASGASLTGGSSPAVAAAANSSTPTLLALVRAGYRCVKGTD